LLFDSNFQSWGPATAVGPLCDCSMVSCSSTLQVVGHVVAVCRFSSCAYVIPHWWVSFRAMVSLIFLVCCLLFSTCKEVFSILGALAPQPYCRTSFFVAATPRIFSLFLNVIVLYRTHLCCNHGDILKKNDHFSFSYKPYVWSIFFIMFFSYYLFLETMCFLSLHASRHLAPLWMSMLDTELRSFTATMKYKKENQMFSSCFLLLKTMHLVHFF
jgi:hypothetical protein